MNRRMKMICLCLLCWLLLAGCGREQTTQESVPNSISELAGKRIALPSGSVAAEALQEAAPQAKILFYDSYGDMLTAIHAGTIDGIATDLPAIRDMMHSQTDLRLLPETFYSAPNGFVFAKTARGETLQGQMNAFLAKIKEDGTLAQLEQKWFSETVPEEPVELPRRKGNEPVLKVATEATAIPYLFIANGSEAGFEAELLAQFCSEYGYGLEFERMAFDSIIPAVTNGVCDLGAGCISITEERKEIIRFSDSTAEVAYGVVLLDTARAIPAFTDVSELKRPGIRLGVQTGTIFDSKTKQLFPDAQIQLFNSGTDMIECVTSGKLDGFLIDLEFAKNISSQNPSITYLPEILIPSDCGIAFPKTEEGNRMVSEMNAFLKNLREDGTLQTIEENWSGNQMGTELPDASVLTGERGEVRLALESLSPPFCFLRNGEIVGIDVDLVIRFCQAYGYRLSIMDMSFDAVLPSLAGVCNMAASAISITEERKEQVNFSDPYYSSGAVVMVRNLRQQQKDGLLDSLKSSFEKTFLRENRWKLILSGIGVTVEISLFTALLGTLLGFGLCMLHRMNRMWVSRLVMGYVRIMQGTPMVVFLMILFYIVFSKSRLSGQAVAVIAFSMNFGAYVSEIMRSGIASIDRGQTEAALALGYTRTQAFFRVILPQAAMQFLPVYKGEFISLVKTTSIVGYIAVQDLTKASDIIRSRTYEAFFPLIATAIIYFLISNLLTAALSAVELKIRPNRNKRSVKGVIEKGANHA